MGTTCRKLLIAASLIGPVIALLPLAAASAACDPALGAVLCPPPDVPPSTPEPAPAPAPGDPAPKPAPQPEPAPQPAPASTPAQAKARLLELVNADRAANGLGALRLRADLDGVAAGHSDRMAEAGRIWHNDDLFTPATKQRLGAKTIGENVASNASIDDAHRRLMASPAHRANLLSGAFSLVGLGVTRGGNSWYVTEVFVEPVPAAGAKAPAGAAPAATTATTAARKAAAARAARGARATATTAAASVEAHPAPAEAGAATAGADAVEIDLTTDGADPAPAELVGRPAPASPAGTTVPKGLAMVSLVTAALALVRCAYRNKRFPSMLLPSYFLSGSSNGIHPVGR